MKLVGDGGLWYVYVRSGQDATLRAIGPGRFVVRFMTGVDWQREERRFRYDRQYAEFDKRMLFVEEGDDEGGTRFSEYTITLHKVIGGTARTTPIDERRFTEDQAIRELEVDSPSEPR